MTAVSHSLCRLVLAAGCLGVPALAAQPVVRGIADLASYSTQLAPGTLVSVFGVNFAAAATSAAEVPLPPSLGGVSLEIRDGIHSVNAPLFYVSPTQINAQVPYEILGPTVQIWVRNSSGLSSPYSLTLQPRAPRVLTANGTGEGEALLFHADNSAVSSVSPAQAGEVLNLYVIGLGAVFPPVLSGAPAGDGTAGGPLNIVSDRVSVLLDGQPANVFYAGLTPYSVGLYQVQFQVPQGVLTSSPTLVVAAEAQQSQPNTSVSVRPPAGRAQYYVAPNGAASANGSKSDPWDLATALKHPPAVRPGDTLWLRGGTYGDGKSDFVSSLSGTAADPIIVRQYPGERATVNGSLTVNGSNAWYWDFEVTNLLPLRQSSVAGSFGGQRTWGINVNGPRTKFINLVLHDADAGFGFWSPAEDAEIYGCLIYSNGWQGPDRGHGHGVYAQNQNGAKHIGDNIIFNQFDLGIQAYGSSNAFVQGFSVDGNIIFNNGLLSSGSQRADNILFGFAGSISGLRLDSNYTYHTPSAESGYSRIGWNFGGFNKDAVITNNYWIGGYFALDLWNWDSLTYTGNTAYATKGTALALTATNNQQIGNYSFTGNSYYGSGLFSYNGQVMNSTSWKSATKLDANSQMHAGRPPTAWTFIRGNQYDPGRANIVVYNWDLASSIDVDLSKVLKPGVSYEIRDAENFYGASLVGGTYNGNPVRIPMTNLAVATPIGNVPTIPKHTAPEFGAFVLLSK